MSSTPTSRRDAARAATMPTVENSRVTRRPPSGPTLAVPRRTVVLACATTDAPVLTPAVRSLVSLGARVEILDGMEKDDRPLQTAARAAREATCWVICMSEALDRARADQLMACLRGCGVAGQDVAIVPFEPRRTEVFAMLVSSHWRAREPYEDEELTARMPADRDEPL